MAVDEEKLFCTHESGISDEDGDIFHPVSSDLFEDGRSKPKQRVTCYTKANVYWNEMETSGLQSAVGLAHVIGKDSKPEKEWSACDM